MIGRLHRELQSRDEHDDHHHRQGARTVEAKLQIRHERSGQCQSGKQSKRRIVRKERNGSQNGEDRQTQAHDPADELALDGRHRPINRDPTRSRFDRRQLWAGHTT